MLAALFRTQIQDGASWDTVTTISVAVLLGAGVVVILALLSSSIRRAVHALKDRSPRRRR